MCFVLKKYLVFLFFLFFYILMSKKIYEHKIWTGGIVGFAICKGQACSRGIQNAVDWRGKVSISEILAVVSIIGGVAGVFFGLFTWQRNLKSDDKAEVTQLTTVIIKLENIGNGVSEIKSEMKNVKADMKDLRDRLIVVEQSVKQAHKRIDRMEGKIDE